MDLTPELLTAAAYGAILLLVAIGQYLNRPKQQQVSKQDPVLAGIGIGYGDKEQTERMIAVLGRMADSLAVLADERTNEIEDMHKALLARLDMQERREEQEEPRRRPDPPRRR